MGIGDYSNFVGANERHLPHAPADLDCSIDECLVAVDVNENGDPGIVFCSECWEPQHETPGGRSCTNGHGGAAGRHESDLPRAILADLDQAKFHGLDVRAKAYEHNARLRTTKETRQMSNEQQATQQTEPTNSNIPTNGSRHKVRALSHTIGEAGTKTKQIGVMCEVTEGPCKGFVSVWYGSFTEDAVEYTMRGLEALGFKGDAPECKSMYTGQEGLAQFEVDKDKDGKPRTRISFINGMDVVMKERYVGAQLANFGAQVNAYYRNKHGGGGAVAGQLPPMQQPPAQHQQPPAPQAHTQQQLPNGRGQQSSAPPWGDDVPPAGATEQAPRSSRW